MQQRRCTALRPSWTCEGTHASPCLSLLRCPGQVPQVVQWPDRGSERFRGSLSRYGGEGGRSSSPSFIRPARGGYRSLPFPDGLLFKPLSFFAHACLLWRGVSPGRVCTLSHASSTAQRARSVDGVLFGAPCSRSTQPACSVPPPGGSHWPRGKEVPRGCNDQGPVRLPRPRRRAPVRHTRPSRVRYRVLSHRLLRTNGAINALLS